MANLVIKKTCDNFKEKIDDILKDLNDDLFRRDELFYKKLKEEDNLDDEVLEKIKESKNKSIKDLELKLQQEIKEHIFDYSKNIVSELFTYIIEKQNETRMASNIQIVKELNELEENDLQETNHPFLSSDLISSITSESSVFGQNDEMNSYFNVFNSITNNSDNDSNNSDDDDNDDDDDDETRKQLDDMNMVQIRQLAKQNDIVLSKSSKKKTKAELIEEILVKLSD